MNMLCFHVWLSLCKAWLNDKQGYIFGEFLGNRGPRAQVDTGFVIPEASQQQDIFMELEKKSKAEKLVLNANQHV